LNYKNIALPIKKPESLKAGDQVFLSGTIYTARDAAHKRLCDELAKNKSPPFHFEGAVVYYTGPCPASTGYVIGSIGPTTSGRMDKYASELIACGLKFMIGKGDRSQAVIDAIKIHKGIYFAAIGGAGALYATCVNSAKVIAYSDLGAEAIYKLQVKNMPLVVAIDTQGSNIYDR